LIEFLKTTWPVLSLFLIPIGGGIPAGVLLAKSRGIHWAVTTFLYFISDVILACVLEPTVKLIIKFARHSPQLVHIGQTLRTTTAKSISHFGTQLGPLTLITIAFGVDPMTGRAAAATAGHGFVMGWIFAITGDMLYFAVLMVSTLFLNELLGDGTVTTIIIMVLMIFVPKWIKMWRERRTNRGTS
jgi:hypothetical protein